MVSYIDLDALIQAAPLTKPERVVLAWTMRGHSLEDIGERYGCAASTVCAWLKSAVLKICEANNQRWIESNRKSFGIF